MLSCPISVRGLAAIVAWCALACLGAASAGAAPLAFTANYEDNSVSVIDTGTNKVVGEPIKVGLGPAGIAITPDGRFAYVANDQGNTVSVIEVATSRVVGGPIGVGKDPELIAISPDGTTAYVADSGSDEVSVIETATNQVVKTIPTGHEPYGIAFAPNGEFAYVGVQGTSAVEVIDTRTRAILGAPIPTGAEPTTIAFAPDGKTAYVTDASGEEVSVIDTGTNAVDSIPVAGHPFGMAVTPDGSKVFVIENQGDAVAVIDAATKSVVEEFPAGEDPFELAITPDGKRLYVASYESEDVRAFDTQTYRELTPPIALTTLGPWLLAITPDQSPIAAFTPPIATATFPALFDGAASTDPDGSVVAWNWAFGDGGTASGVNVAHTYASPGTFTAKLSVLDNEGCGEAQVFTGRTAYCSGAAGATHPVTVDTQVVPPSNKFRIGRLIHNRRKGTARMQLTLPGAGYVYLFGRKVHAVTRKAKAKGSLWLTIHARVRLNKQLKKIHRAPVQIRVTFTPNGGTARTVHRSLTLLRAPHHRHHGR